MERGDEIARIQDGIPAELEGESGRAVERILAGSDGEICG